MKKGHIHYKSDFKHAKILYVLTAHIKKNETKKKLHHVDQVCLLHFQPALLPKKNEDFFSLFVSFFFHS